MLDSPESVCAGQAGFEYPATSVLFSNFTASGVQQTGEPQAGMGGEAGVADTNEGHQLHSGERSITGVVSGWSGPRGSLAS
jgi:hypothetical protein